MSAITTWWQANGFCTSCNRLDTAQRKVPCHPNMSTRACLGMPTCPHERALACQHVHTSRAASRARPCHGPSHTPMFDTHVCTPTDERIPRLEADCACLRKKQDDFHFRDAGLVKAVRACRCLVETCRCLVGPCRCLGRTASTRVFQRCCGTCQCTCLSTCMCTCPYTHP